MPALDLDRRVPDCALAADLVGSAATRDLDEIIRAVTAEQSSALAGGVIRTAPGMTA